MVIEFAKGKQERRGGFGDRGGGRFGGDRDRGFRGGRSGGGFRGGRGGGSSGGDGCFKCGKTNFGNFPICY
jgi:hypothetical protein